MSDNKLVRISPMITTDAKKVYDSWPSKQKHFFVSSAIIAYNSTTEYVTMEKHKELKKVISDYIGWMEQRESESTKNINFLREQLAKLAVDVYALKQRVDELEGKG